MGIGCLLYALFYTILLYRNASGITYPFFVGGTCLFFFYYLKRSGITAKKDSAFIVTGLLLLGVSICSTDSSVLLFLDKLLIFCLFFYLMLHNIYEDRKWDLGKYAASILKTAFSSLRFLGRPFTDFAHYREAKAMEAAGKNCTASETCAGSENRIASETCAGSENRIANESHAGSENHAATENRTGHPYSGQLRHVFYGLLISLPLLAVILLLLGSADAVFRTMLDRIFEFPDLGKLGEHLFSASVLYLFAFFASYCIACRLDSHNLIEEEPDRRRAEPVMGITFTGLVSLVYLVFCFIQIVYLFGGLGTLPVDYTYASYAREGFFQLVFVCLINIAMVLLCRKFFRKSRILSGILTFISLCTYIMIFSSAYRMILYIQQYYLTFLRLFVLWALVVIFLMMTGALLTIYREEFPLVKYCLYTVTILYLLFAFAHPDYWIARYNLSRSMTVAEAAEWNVSTDSCDDTDGYSCYRGYEDYHYLSSLSLDAAPVIFACADSYAYGGADSEGNLSYEKSDYDWWFLQYDSRLPVKKSIRQFNFSRWIAEKTYKTYCETHPAYVSVSQSDY